MLTATQWQEKEIERLVDGFAQSGKAKRIYEPPRKLFVSDEEYHLALTMRVKLCDKAQHDGNRVMICNNTNFYCEKGAPVHCKSCKMGKSRQVTASKRKERIVVYTTAEDWFANVAHDTTRDGKTIGSCRLPLKDEFAADEEYEKAKELHQARHQEFQRQFHARKDVREKDNAYHREEYANMSAEEKKQKMDRDQVNKDARKAVALKSGMDWCPFGSHATNPADMIFCPKADLGITDFHGRVGLIKRDICKQHYSEWIRQDRSFKQKYRDDISLRIRFRLEWWRNSAKRRGKSIALSYSEQEKIVTSRCNYCDQPSTDAKPNGIDMLDAMCTEYRTDTCVASCGQCNMSKGGMLPQDYVKKCIEVAMFQKKSVRATNYIVYRRVCFLNNTRVGRLFYRGASNYNTLKYGAMRRNLSFSITESEFYALKKKGCAYCGLMRPMFIGMDRIDNSKGYTIDNVCGCCTTCNMMKRVTEADEFVQKCIEVATNNCVLHRIAQSANLSIPSSLRLSPFNNIVVVITQQTCGQLCWLLFGLKKIQRCFVL